MSAAQQVVVAPMSDNLAASAMHGRVVAARMHDVEAVALKIDCASLSKNVPVDVHGDSF